MEISKELLGGVLPFKNLDGRTWQHSLIGNNINITYNINKWFGGFTYQINIYELTFKLKMWAEEVFPEIYIATCIAENGEEWVAWSNNTQYIECYFYADTELEATIKACEWVLEKINGNK